MLTSDGHLSTPYLAVDAARVERNVAEMATSARHREIVLLPHAKTHKTFELARLQLAAGATGLTVATVSEAEVFAAAGFTDLFIAYPLWVDRSRGARVRELVADVALTVGVDSLEGADALAAQLGEDRAALRVLVEIDSGHHRTGVPPAEAGDLADRVAHAGLDVRGVFTYPGHGYAPGHLGGVAAQEASALAQAAESLRRRGISPEIVSGGSTPTASSTAPGAVTHLRPGVYVFNDAQQLELDTCTFEDVALTAIATVVSHANGHVVLDSGSKVLGADRAPWASGYGRLLDHPDARIGQLSEHHAVVTWPEHTPRPPLGTTVRVVPNHVCSAVNLADEILVLDGLMVVDRWQVAARGANS